MAVKEIDGSVLEGGGQIIRISVALSCLLEQAIQIIKIRAGRASPGLKPQHLAGIHLVKDMCNAVTSGDQQNSCVLSFEPQSLKVGNFNLFVDPKTAASITLMIQSVLPVAIFSNCESTITMKGGTDVSFAPPMDYVRHVLFPIYRKLFGISCDVQINKRGFYPKGGGEVKLTVNPLSSNGYLNPIEMIDSGSNFECSIKGTIFISGLIVADTVPIPSEIGITIKDLLREYGYANVTIETNVDSSNIFGGSILLVADTGNCLIGACALYDRKKTSTEIVTELCDKLVLDLKSKSCVDANTMDNLIIFMALANGKSRVNCREITLHTKTAIYIAEQLTKAKFSIKQTAGGLNEIICDGIGLKRHF